MNGNTLAVEGVLEFRFHAPWRKADYHVPQGLMSVDFIVYGEDTLYLVEIKDFEHPDATTENKRRDYKKLTDPESAFPLEMGMKVKDTLLRMYADGENFGKPVKFLLIVKLAKLEPGERATLFEWTSKYIPTGLKQSLRFTSIGFDVPTLQDCAETYGFSVSVHNVANLRTF
jgi:hypothetical protein